MEDSNAFPATQNNDTTADEGNQANVSSDMPGEEEDDYDDEDFCDIKFAASGSLVNRDGDLVAFAFSCVDQVLADMVGQAMDEAAPPEAGQDEQVPQDVTADLLQPVRYLMDNFGELLYHFTSVSDAEAEV